MPDEQVGKGIFRDLRRGMSKKILEEVFIFEKNFSEVRITRNLHLQRPRQDAK
jgi:hypothetical protein